jgi:hypothetical protein
MEGPTVYGNFKLKWALEKRMYVMKMHGVWNHLRIRKRGGPL